MASNRDLERLSRDNFMAIRRAAAKLGMDGSPVEGLSVYIPEVKPKLKRSGGRPKGRKNLTLRERLQRRGYFD